MRSRCALLRVVVSVLAASGACGCSWDALWGLDAPRPAIGPNDPFRVDPLCPDLIVDPSGAAAVPRIVTLTGRRQSGLGAESVPVSVRRGPCSDAFDAGAAVADGGATQGSAQAMPADGGPGSATEGEAASGCYGASEALDSAYADAIELVELEDRGCRQRSPSLLECTLNARGEAAFGVLGHLPDDEVILGGYVPICVTPLEIKGSRKRREVRVFPRLGSSKLAVAVLQLSGDQPPAEAPEGAACGSLYDCDEPRARATFQAGVVSADIPTPELRASDFLPVRRDLELSVHLRTLDTAAGAAAGAFLSTSASCAAGGDAGAPEPDLQLEIRQPLRDTDVFYLCATGFSASYQITAELAVADAADAGTPTAASNVEAPAARPSTVALMPLPEGYVSEASSAGQIVHTALCGGMLGPTDPEAIRRVSGARIVDHEGRVVIACESIDPDADAGAASAVGSQGSSMAAACGEIALELTSGGTCRLDVTEGS